MRRSRDGEEVTQVVGREGRVVAEHAAGVAELVLAFVREGGPLLPVNLLVLACALLLAAERGWVLLRRGGLDARPFMDQVAKLVRSGNVDRALRLCTVAPHALLCRVVRAGLARAARGQAGADGALRDALAEESQALVHRLPWLGRLALLALVVGLGGAALGLADALHAPADARLEVAQLLRAALPDLALGLAVAAVCAGLLLLLLRRARALRAGVAAHVAGLEPLLAPGGAPPARDPAARAG